MYNIILIVMIIAGIINSIISFCFNAKVLSILISIILIIGFSFPICYAINNKKIYTKQDGIISFYKNQYIFVLALVMLIIGYSLGILAPWILKE